VARGEFRRLAARLIQPRADDLFFFFSRLGVPARKRALGPSPSVEHGRQEARKTHRSPRVDRLSLNLFRAMLGRRADPVPLSRELAPRRRSLFFVETTSFVPGNEAGESTAWRGPRSRAASAPRPVSITLQASGRDRRLQEARAVPPRPARGHLRPIAQRRTSDIGGADPLRFSGWPAFAAPEPLHKRW